MERFVLLDLNRLFKRKIFIYSIIVFTIFFIINAYSKASIYYSWNGAEGVKIIFNKAKLPLSPLLYANLLVGDSPPVVEMIVTYLSPMLLSLIAADLVFEDLNTGYIKSCLPRIGMNKYIISKVISFVVFSIFYMVLIHIIFIITNGLFFPFITGSIEAILTERNQLLNTVPLRLDSIRGTVYQYPYLGILISALIITLYSINFSIFTIWLPLVFRNFNRAYIVLMPTIIYLILKIALSGVNYGRYTISGMIFNNRGSFYDFFVIIILFLIINTIIGIIITKKKVV